MSVQNVENPVKVEHAAAAILKDLPSARADVAALQAVKQKEGSAKMFEKDSGASEVTKEPNFTEMKDTVAKVVAADPSKAYLTNRVIQLQEIVEGKPPSIGGPDAHVKLIGEIAAKMPGIVAAISKDTGLPPAVVKNRLKVSLTGMRPYLNNMLKDEAFIKNLTKNLGTVEYTEQMADDDTRYTALDKKLTDQQTDLDTRKKVYTNPGGVPPGAKEWFNAKLPGEQAGLKKDVADYKKNIAILSNTALGDLSRSALTAAEVAPYQGELDAEIVSLAGAGHDYAFFTVGGNDIDATIGALAISPAEKTRRQNEVRKVIKAYKATADINTIYGRPIYGGSFDNEMAKLQLFNQADTELATIQTAQNNLDQEKIQLAKLKIQREKKLNEYGTKVGTALDKSFREYYNDVLLEDAKHIAELDAQKKADEKKEKETLETKRKTDAQEMVDRFLRLSLLKYKAGKVVGWDDEAIKKFVKKDLTSSSPEQMARKLLDRVYYQRSYLPASYKAEIDTLLKDMGVGSGPPPVTWPDVVKSLDSPFLKSMATTEMPKLLGYAYARGYYFDKLHMTRPQAEFLKTAYNAEFFTEAGTHSDTFKTEFEKEFGTGVLKGSEEMKHKIKEILGGDYEKGFKRLMKVAAVAGLAGVGGALALDFIGGSAGVQGGIDTLGGIAEAGKHLVYAASMGTTEALRNTSNAVTDAAYAFEQKHPLPPVIPKP